MQLKSSFSKSQGTEQNVNDYGGALKYVDYYQKSVFCSLKIYNVTLSFRNISQEKITEDKTK